MVRPELSLVRLVHVPHLIQHCRVRLPRPPAAQSRLMPFAHQRPRDGLYSKARQLGSYRRPGGGEGGSRANGFGNVTTCALVF